MTWWAVALRLTGLGWYIALCIVGGIVGGWGLDKFLGTPIPIFMLLGIIVGSVVAFWGVYRMVLPVLYGAKHQEIIRKRRHR